jgi:hypothetical protein
MYTMSEVSTKLWTPRMGVDIGRVISAQSTDGQYSLLDEDNYLSAPEAEGAVDTLRDIVVPNFGPENTFLVSKAKEKTQRRTTEWLEHIDFFERTGILEEHVFFCLERPQKAEIAKELGLTDFIDDRDDVFEAMPTDQVHFKLLFAPEQFRDKGGLVRKRGDIYVVNGWLGVRAVFAARQAVAEA